MGHGPAVHPRGGQRPRGSPRSGAGRAGAVPRGRAARRSHPRTQREDGDGPVLAGPGGRRASCWRRARRRAKAEPARPAVEPRKASKPTPGRRPARRPRVGQFADPDEDRTWVFDVTFLLSDWQCIYGDGCQGVLTGPAPELEQGCCSYGAHFTDDEDVDRVQAAAAHPDPRRVAVPPGPDGGPGWYDRRRRGQRDPAGRTARASSSTDRASPAAPGARSTAAALERGAGPLELKPDVCWQLPLRREDDDGRRPATSPRGLPVGSPALGRRGAGIPLVVHRGARGVRRAPSRLREHGRRACARWSGDALHRGWSRLAAGPAHRPERARSPTRVVRLEPETPGALRRRRSRPVRSLRPASGPARLGVGVLRPLRPRRSSVARHQDA